MTVESAGQAAFADRIKSAPAGAGNTPRGLTRSTSTHPKEGLAMKATRICSIPECTRPHRAKGWCAAHYGRWERHGDPLAGNVIPQRPARCAADECERPAVRREWCGAHHARYLRHGDPLGGGPEKAQSHRPTLDRLMENVQRRESGCWEWTGGRVNEFGYARMWVYPTPGDTDGRVGWFVHRVSYTEHVGPIPEGLTIDHLCCNKICVNPEHLEAVTLLENSLRHHIRAGHKVVAS